MKKNFTQLQGKVQAEILNKKQGSKRDMTCVFLFIDLCSV